MLPGGQKCQLKVPLGHSWWQPRNPLQSPPKQSLWSQSATQRCSPGKHHILHAFIRVTMLI